MASASYDFSATANPISSPPWSQINAGSERGQAVNSHWASITAANLNGACYTDITWTGDHFSQATLVAKSDNQYSVAVRASITVGDVYLFGAFPNFQGNHLYNLFRYVGGSGAFIGSPGIHTATIGDVVYLEIVGSTLTGKVNGVQELQATNTEITAAGFPGVSGSHLSLANFEMWDTWSAADISGSATISLLQIGR